MNRGPSPGIPHTAGPKFAIPNCCFGKLPFKCMQIGVRTEGTARYEISPILSAPGPGPGPGPGQAGAEPGRLPPPSMPVDADAVERVLGK